MARKEKDTVEIMIIDDHPIVRQGLKMIIEREDRFKICAEASNASDAIRIIGDAKPAIAIVDISLEGTTNGIELVKAIKERYPSIVCIVLSMYDESLYAERAIRAGAKGYVMKKEADENIISAINMVLSGELYLSEGMSKTIVNKLLHGSSDKELLPETSLSDRELEIFMMIGNGVSMKDVARQLNLSLNTVETHRRHIREKMQFKDNNELVKYAVQWVFLNKR
jgi:DNA-binding NarL/FixJ family response regulator